MADRIILRSLEYRPPIGIISSKLIEEEFTEEHAKILRVLRLSGKNALNIQQVSKLLGSAYSSILRYCNELIKLNILTEETKVINGKVNRLIRLSPNFEVILPSEALKSKLDTWKEYKQAMINEVKLLQDSEDKLAKRIREFKGGFDENSRD